MWKSFESEVASEGRVAIQSERGGSAKLYTPSKDDELTFVTFSRVHTGIKYMYFSKRKRIKGGDIYQRKSCKLTDHNVGDETHFVRLLQLPFSKAVHSLF